MAKRSNLRQLNPFTSEVLEPVLAIGSRRANSPSWPCIETMLKLEAEYTCAVGTGAKAKEACNEGESIYGQSTSPLTLVTCIHCITAITNVQFCPQRVADMLEIVSTG